jgi:hypothetical protein
MPVVVGERDAVDARVAEAGDEIEHGLLEHMALEGTAERRREAHRDLHPGLVRDLHHRREFGERLLVGPVDVRPVVGLGRGDHGVHLVRLPGRGRRILGAAYVGHERDVDHAGNALDAGEHFVRVSERRDGHGGDERGHLDLVQPGPRELVDHLDLGGGRDEFLLDLEAVANRDVVDVETHG